MNPIIFELLINYSKYLEKLDTPTTPIVHLIKLKNTFLDNYLEAIRQFCNITDHKNYTSIEIELMDAMDKCEIVLIEILKELIELMQMEIE